MLFYSHINEFPPLWSTDAFQGTLQWMDFRDTCIVRSPLMATIHEDTAVFGRLGLICIQQSVGMCILHCTHCSSYGMVNSSFAARKKTVDQLTLVLTVQSIFRDHSLLDETYDTDWTVTVSYILNFCIFTLSQHWIIVAYLLSAENPHLF